MVKLQIGKKVDLHQGTTGQCLGRNILTSLSEVQNISNDFFCLCETTFFEKAKQKVIRNF